MKKLSNVFFILVVIACLGFYGCFPSPQDDAINSMECPVILKAKAPAKDRTCLSISLQGGNGDIISFAGGYPFSEAIYSTYFVGDTIRKCNK